jgi:6-phosphogluconolactonase
MPVTMVYVSCAEPREIIRLAMDRDSGALQRLDSTYVPGIDTASGTSMPLAVSPDRRFLYAALRRPPYPAASFAIDPHDGSLRHLGNAPLPHTICYINVDRSGRHLLAASYQGALLASHKIGDDGVVQSPPTQVVPTPPAAHSIIQDASGRFVYAASLGGDVVMRLRFDAASGTFSDMQTAAVPTGAGSRHIRIRPDGKFLYVLDELDATICVFVIDPTTGLLDRRQVVRTQPEGFAAKAADLHLTPDGRFLYASERRTSTLTGFRIDDASGTLSPIGAFPTETFPRGFAIDPRGRFLLAVGQESHAMSVYSIDAATGGLTRIAQHEMARNPNWIEIVDLTA